MDTVSFGAPTYAYADVLSLVALEQLRRSELRLEPQKGPIPTVLDTSCVRTGLQDQLKKRRLPASLYAAQVGRTRLFMEHDAVTETWNRLPRFAYHGSLTSSGYPRSTSSASSPTTDGR